MGPTVLALYAVIVVGSLCGFRAVFRLGMLAHRLAQLEQRLVFVEVQRSPAALGHRAPLRSALASPDDNAAATATATATATAATANAANAANTARDLISPPRPPAHDAGLATSLASPAAAEGGPVEPPPPMIPATLPPAPPPPATSSRPAPPPRPRDADWWHVFELRAGTRWVTWAGASALVIAAALFVKLAIDRGWLGPVARLAFSAAGGIGLLIAGRRAHRAEMRPLSQGLFGAGLGVLYVATYVAYASYGLLARELVFASMLGVTITGCVIAIRHDAQPIAVLALLGGLLTPVAAASGESSREALFAYLLILDLGALAVAVLRRWSVLELLAMVGTWVLFAGSLSLSHGPVDRPVVLAWLAVFHALFVAVPFGLQLRNRIPASLDRTLFWLGNAAFAIAISAEILGTDERALGGVLLGMSAMYGAVEVAARYRLGERARASFAFVMLAAGLATLAVPLLFRDHAVTALWALEAPLVLALGFHDRRHGLRLAALGIAALAVLHGAITCWPSHASALRPFANPTFAGALLAPLAAGLLAAAHRLMRHRGDVRDRWHGVAAGLAGGGVLLALVHAEVVRSFALAGRPDLGDATLPILWSIGSLLALAAVGRREALPASIRAAIAFAAVFAAGLCLVAYRAPAHPDAMLALNLRFVGALVTSAAIAVNAAATARRHPDHALLAWTLALTGFGIAIGAEAYLHYSVYDPISGVSRRAHTALSIAWSCYAVVLLGFGFARQDRRLRLAGLGLLGGVAVKLLLIDLAGAPQAYRVLSFLVVGALMIGVSFAYHRFERRREPPEA